MTKAKAGDATRAVGYVRVSTVEQDLGPEAQRNSIEAWAARQGVVIVAWHEDRLSGALPVDKRPALLAAIEGLREHGAGLLVAAKRDRLARSVAVAAAVEQLAQDAGARIVTADGVAVEDTDEGALLKVILDGFSQYERARIRARTKAALAVKKGRGERVGSIPYGRRLAEDGKRLEACREEQAALTRARQLQAERRSLRAIARALDAEGYRNRAGRAFHPYTIARMLQTAAQAA